jgi:hypothetical protein
MRLLGLGAFVLALASCGGSEPDLSRKPSPDPRQLIVRLSDLPPRFSLVAGETRPTSLELVLADPWSAGLEDEIKRERVSGFKRAVWSPGGRRIECSIAVYRSVTGAQRVFRLGSGGFRPFLTRRHLGMPWRVGQLGEGVRAFRFDLGRLEGLSVTWRDGIALTSCSVLGAKPVDREELMEVVSAQRRRIATALG